MLFYLGAGALLGQLARTVNILFVIYLHGDRRSLLVAGSPWVACCLWLPGLEGCVGERYIGVVPGLEGCIGVVNKDRLRR